MARPTGLRGIAFCYFAVHHSDGTRYIKTRRVLWLGVFPLLLGVVLTCRLGSLSGSNLALVVAVLSVLAAVLVGLLPLAHSILAQSETLREYKQGQLPLAQHELDRVQVLQDLHASISWAVALLVLGLGVSAIIALIGPIQTSSSGFIHRASIVVLTFTLYAVMASTSLTFFDVATGIFEAMESHAKCIKDRIRKNIQPNSGPDKEL